MYNKNEKNRIDDWLDSKEGSPEDTPQEKPKSKKTTHWVLGIVLSIFILGGVYIVLAKPVFYKAITGFKEEVVKISEIQEMLFDEFPDYTISINSGFVNTYTYLDINVWYPFTPEAGIAQETADNIVEIVTNNFSVTEYDSINVLVIEETSSINFDFSYSPD